MELDIRHDERRRRFRLTRERGQAYLRYRPAGEGMLDYVYTFVPKRHRGRGIGEALVKYALNYARDHGYAVIPTCGFVQRVIGRNPEYQELVASR